MIDPGFEGAKVVQLAMLTYEGPGRQLTWSVVHGIARGGSAGGTV